MRPIATIALLALALPAGAQQTPAPAAAQTAANVRVTARIVLVDREALTRAGLDYLVVGHDRIRIRSSAAGRSRSATIAAGIHGVTAFLEAARASRWIRSESTQQILVLEGREGVVAATDLTLGRHAARTRGPSLVVVPSVLPDGRIHLWLSTGVEDRVSYAWGYGAEASPAAVETEVVAAAGEEVVVASSSADRSTGEAGLLSWGRSEQGRGVLVAVSAEPIP